MNMIFLILALLSQIFAFCFLCAAVFVFATGDTKPLDPQTARLLSFNAWFGGGWLSYFYIVSRNWRHCRLGRRCAYAGLSFSGFAFVLGILAARG